MSHYFKKISFILSIVLLLPIFSACAKQGASLDPKHPSTVIIWHYYNGMQKAAFDELVNQFNTGYGAEKGIIVTAESKGSVDDLAVAVTDAAEKKVGSDDLPNLFAAYTDTAFILHEQQLLADMMPYFTEKELKEYVPAFIQEGTLEKDKLFVFPIAKSTELLYINETDWEPFAKATGTDYTSLSTWEGLVQTAEKYYKWSNGKILFGRDAFANYLLVGSEQLGKPIFSAKNEAEPIQLDEAVLRRLWDNYAIPYLKGYFGVFGRFRSDDVKTGDLIAYVGSTASSTYFPAEVTLADGTSYAIQGKVLPLPNFEKTQPYSAQQGAGIAMLKKDPTSELAAIEFLKWLTEEEQNIQFCTQSSYSPVKESANTDASIRAALDANGFTEGSITYENAVMSAQTFHNINLYINRPFQGSSDARLILTDFMTSKLDAIKVNIAGLTPLEIDEKNDELFQQWFSDLSKALFITQ